APQLNGCCGGLTTLQTSSKRGFTRGHKARVHLLRARPETTDRCTTQGQSRGGVQIACPRRYPGPPIRQPPDRSKTPGSLRAPRGVIIATMASPNKYASDVPGFRVDWDDTPAPSPVPNPIRSLIDNHELISDLARFAEGQAPCTEAAIRKKWRLT